MSFTPREQRSFANWIDAFLTDRKASGAASRTVVFYREKLRHFVGFCREQGIGEVEAVTPDVIRAFLLGLGQAGHRPGGVHAHYRSVKTFLRWYEAEVEPENWRNPIRKVKPPKVPEELLNPVSLDDVAAMLDTCKGGKKADLRDKAILLTLLDTGIRASELCSLDLADADLYAGEIIVRLGKGRKPRAVFAGQKTRRALRAYVKARGQQPGPLFLSRTRNRLTYWGLRLLLERRARLAGVAASGAHAFRRAFALTSLRNGADTITLQRLLGHSSMAVVLRYVKQTEADLQAVHGATSPVDRGL